jgi:hypothetical protein
VENFMVLSPLEVPVSASQYVQLMVGTQRDARSGTRSRDLTAGAYPMLHACFFFFQPAWKGTLCSRYFVIFPDDRASISEIGVAMKL